MNPGKLNHRIKFSQETTVTNQYGGVAVTTTEVLTTWGNIEPLAVRQYNQFRMDEGVSELDSNYTCVIRYRQSFTPTKTMIFEDLENPGDIYTIRTILPYFPGTKSTFQNGQSTVYKDKWYVYLVGVKRV